MESNNNLSTEAVIFTDAAAMKVGTLLTEEENQSLNLRVYVTGGGCAGFQYGFSFDENKDEGDTESATGEIKINTLWGLGSVTNLKFNGEAKFNGSTGITDVVAKGQGTITVRPNQPKYITANISASLAPDRT